MALHALTPDLLTLIAHRFRVLGEPARLEILNVLRRGERTVSELVAETGFGQTNVSKHLRVMHDAGLVVRRRAGSFVHYAIIDARVFRLCDVMCDQLQNEIKVRERFLRVSRGAAAKHRAAS